MSSHAHEPREEFVDQLEHRLRADLRRQRLETHVRPWFWLPQSRLAAGLALIAIMLGSMAVGGGVVAASYETRMSGQREQLLSRFDQQLVVAQLRHRVNLQQLQEMLNRVAVGLEQKENLVDIRSRVNESLAEVKSTELDIAEIKVTGREPMQSLSAPLVGGRDFVTERWRVEMAVPVEALELEKMRADGARRRVEVGIGKREDVEEAMTRIGELQTAVEIFDKKLAIRQTFLKGGMPAALADLRGIEVETELRRRALTLRIENARRRVQDIKRLVDVGTANPLQLAEVKLRLQELELETTKIDYELLLIRKQLGKEE